MLYNPAAVALAGIIFWFVVRLLAPLEAIHPLVPGALIYIIVCYAAFFVGCKLSDSLRLKRAIPGPGLSMRDRPFPVRMFWWSFTIGLLGMAIRLFDRIVVRSIDYSINQVEIRDQLMATGGSLYGAVASVLLPFSFVPLILLLAFTGRKHSAGHYALAIFVFTLPMLESLQVLSRSLALVTATLAFSAWACLRFDGNIFNRRVVLTALGGFVSLIIFSTTVFSSRLNDVQFSLLDSVVLSGYAHTIAPNPSASSSMMAGNELERGFYNAVVPNTQYYLHGLYEFGILYDRPDTQIFGLGTYMFYPYVRVYNFIFGNEEAPAISYAYLRPGIFVTFFGEIWADFGWVGPIFLLALGYIISSFASMARQGKINILPIYLFSITGIFYMPVANLLTGGSAFFIMHGFILFAIFAGFSSETLPRRRIAAESGSDLQPHTS